MDFRIAAARLYDECGSSIEVAEQLGCSESWVRKLIQRRRDQGTLEIYSCARVEDQRKIKEADQGKIRELLQTKPDATLVELVAVLSVPVHVGTMSKALKRMDLPRKKSPPLPANKTGPT
jgi:transposase